MGDLGRVAPVQQERRVAGGGAPQGERGDRAHGAAPRQVARVADELPERQAARGGRPGSIRPGTGELVRQGLVDVHAIEVAAQGQVHPPASTGEARGEEPVAGPVVEQLPRVQRGDRVGVARIPAAVRAQRPHVRGRRSVPVTAAAGG